MSKLEMEAPVLSVRQLTKRFGGLTAVADVSFEVASHQVTALIGPNGAGKTTLFNLTTGLYQPDEGGIEFFGQPLSGKKPHEIAELGLGRTFQNIRLFRNLSVLENVLIGTDHKLRREGLLSSIWKGPQYKALATQGMELAQEILSILGLEKFHNLSAGSLSYGNQRKLEIARALGTGAKLLCLDEPAAGMNPSEKVDLMGLIRDIKERFHVSIFLIEHDMRLVMGVSDHVVVLDHGTMIARGTPSSVRENPLVVEAYLGSKKERKGHGTKG